MKLEEKISKLHNLSKDFEKLSFIVHSMETNEDAPMYNVEWGKALQERFNKVYNHVQSLIGDLKL
jgi:hypothetical protein